MSHDHKNRPRDHLLPDLQKSHVRNRAGLTPPHEGYVDFRGLFPLLLLNLRPQNRLIIIA
jgi:hypothetical protein